jgi:arginine decarboxylase
MIFKPSRVYLVASEAEGITPLNAFDNALMRVGLADLNLVKVSSVFPPHCELADSVEVPPGSVVPCVYTSFVGRERGERIAAAISLGIPGDSSKAGVVMEFSGNVSSVDARTEAERMVVDAMKRRSVGAYVTKSAHAEHEVESCGCVIAALLLLP